MRHTLQPFSKDEAPHWDALRAQTSLSGSHPRSMATSGAPPNDRRGDDDDGADDRNQQSASSSSSSSHHHHHHAHCPKARDTCCSPSLQVPHKPNLDVKLHFKQSSCENLPFERMQHTGSRKESTARLFLERKARSHALALTSARDVGQSKKLQTEASTRPRVIEASKSPNKGQTLRLGTCSREIVSTQHQGRSCAALLANTTDE